MKATILRDSIYLLCISQARNSKSKTERYGCILMKDNEIIGMGYNRRPRQDDVISMGWANHAEINALNDAFKKDNIVKGSIIFAAGYFQKDGSLHIRPSKNYTCPKCPRYLMKYGVIEINVPLIDGWVGLSVDEALEYAQNFKKNRYEKRLLVGKSKYNLKDLNLEDLLI